MQNALTSELLLMSQCSQKKANAIIEARPFENWIDIVQKFQNNKYLDTELLNSAQVNNSKNCNSFNFHLDCIIEFKLIVIVIYCWKNFVERFNNDSYSYCKCSI